MRTHLESLARQGDPEATWRLANPPPLSSHVAHLWGWYADLCQTSPERRLWPLAPLAPGDPGLGARRGRAAGAVGAPGPDRPRRRAPSNHDGPRQGRPDHQAAPSTGGAARTFGRAVVADKDLDELIADLKKVAVATAGLTVAQICGQEGDRPADVHGWRLRQAGDKGHEGCRRTGGQGQRP
ncbi:hypothetical protein ACRAWD_10030 [Caulobacter segnis]